MGKQSLLIHALRMYSISATGEVTAQVALADVAEVNAAVAAAKAGVPSVVTPIGAQACARCLNSTNCSIKMQRNWRQSSRASMAKYSPDALGEVQRGIEVVEFGHRHSAVDERRIQRASGGGF